MHSRPTVIFQFTLTTGFCWACSGMETSGSIKSYRLVSARLFSAVADALQWATEKNGAKLVFHYLDDFITIGPPHSSDCQESLSSFCLHVLNWVYRWKSRKARVPHPVLSFSAWNWTLQLKPSASLKKNSQGCGYGWKNGGTVRQLAREIYCRLLVTCNTHLKR